VLFSFALSALSRWFTYFLRWQGEKGNKLELSPFVTVCLCVAALLILGFNRLPIAFAFALVGFVGITWLLGFEQGLIILSRAPFAWATNVTFLPLPLFLLMGQLVFYLGISGDLFYASHKWVGRFPGGVAISTMLAGTAFGACCGSPLAGAATMGAIAYPEMEQRNYDHGLATATPIVAGSISGIIPPSLSFIIYGFLSHTSIAALFIAGVLPGILLAGMYVVTTYIMCKRNPKLGPRGSSYPWREMFISLKGIWGVLVLFLLVIGGLYAGVFTPSEAAAIGAFGAFVIGLATRRLSFHKFNSAIKSTLETFCFVMTIFIGASILNTFLGLIGLSAMFQEWLDSLVFSRYIVLSIILIAYIILGMILDIAPIMILTIPIIVPPLVNLGFDPIVIGVLITISGGLGLMTPPVAVAAYTVHGMTKVPLGVIFRGLIPFIIVTVLSLPILTAFPQISLFLPSIMGK
jgi:C4-dicarboxylate transporter DctM subunit